VIRALVLGGEADSSATRAARVSGRLAAAIHVRMISREPGGNASKRRRAVALRARAFNRSSGISSASTASRANRLTSDALSEPSDAGSKEEGRDGENPSRLETWAGLFGVFRRHRLG
jgi:hypothetical protein